MADPIDFPASPYVGQKHTTSTGLVYEWTGYAWVIGFYDSASQSLGTVADVISYVRTLIQDTDDSSGSFRYSTDSIIAALNQCMMELFRLRPDLFLYRKYTLPKFTSADLATTIGIEDQYMPPILYYVVGMVQVRDDEQNQDGRALAFLKVFQNAVVNGGLAA